MNCDKTGEKFAQIFIPCERPFRIAFWEKEWLMENTPSTWNYESTVPRWSEIADFEPIIARSASSVTPSEKSSINTNRKSTTCFPTSLRWYRTLPLSIPKGGGQKMQNGRYPSKIAFRWKKVCYKVSLCENCQRHSSKAFIGLTIHAKMIVGERPLIPEILGQTDRVGSKSPIFDLYSLVAP